VDLRVLLVEDSPYDAELSLRRLRADGLQPDFLRVESEAGLRDALTSPDWQVALVDYNLPGFDGIAALRVIADLRPDLPAITVSGAISEDTAVATLTAGAIDYVLKDNLARLVPAVRRAVEAADLRRERRRAAEQARQSQFAIDHASQAIIYVSDDGVILYVNEAAERFGGLPRDEAVGARIWGWADLVDEAVWARLWQAGSSSSSPRWSASSATRARS
jgi:PAS domain S-box-containing protein